MPGRVESYSAPQATGPQQDRRRESCLLSRSAAAVITRRPEAGVAERSGDSCNPTDPLHRKGEEQFKPFHTPADARPGTGLPPVSAWGKFGHAVDDVGDEPVIGTPIGNSLGLNNTGKPPHNVRLHVSPGKTTPTNKSGLHPRNRHRSGYDFAALTRSCRRLATYVHPNPAGDETIDFADPAAVRTLNQALLNHHYGIAQWEVPRGHLCPPIPGRADYIHHVADLLAKENPDAIPRGPAVIVLDIGVGANCVYPIIGAREYGWRFIGTDIDPLAIAWARKLVAANPNLAGLVECRLQHSRERIFEGCVQPGETFAVSMCNPPFHASPEEAAAGTLRKLWNLTGTKRRRPVLNFGGQGNELWCEGGESGFVRRMIAESASRPGTCGWFTTLVSKQESLPGIYRTLDAVKPADIRTINLAHGQKKSRIVAWRFPGGHRVASRNLPRE